VLNRSLQIANFALLAALLFLSISAQPVTITGKVIAIADAALGFQAQQSRGSSQTRDVWCNGW
jgi:hypothetical protein